MRGQRGAQGWGEWGCCRPVGDSVRPHHGVLGVYGLGVGFLGQVRGEVARVTHPVSLFFTK